MSWNEWTGWDTAGQMAGALGEAMGNAATFFDNTAKELFEQAVTSTRRAELYRAMWEQLDTLTVTAMRELDAIEPGRLSVEITAKIDAMKAELSKAASFIESAEWNVSTSKNLDALGKNLGAVVGAAEVLYGLSKDDFTAYDFGESALGMLGGVIGAGIAAVAGATLLPSLLVGAGLGIAGKFVWEKYLAPEIGWPAKNGPLFWDEFFGRYFPYTPSNEALIASLQSKFTQAEATISPLVLDLDGDGVSTLSKTAGVHFDHDGNGFAEQTGWADAADGMLAFDRNGNGTIDSGAELFGNHTRLADGTVAANGFAALADIDSDHDGDVDSADAGFGGLRVWRDLNSNGITENGELLTLQEAGVQSLSVSYTEANTSGTDGNLHKQVGSYTRSDGSVAGMDDVWFAVDTARTVDQDLVEVSAEIAALPEVAGFGNVHSLRQAMARDASGELQALVRQYIVVPDLFIFKPRPRSRS